MAENKCDGKVKILMLGESGVGKSSLLMRFVQNKFMNDFITTLGVEYRQKQVQIGGQNILVQVWDTAGQERFRTITPVYYRSVQGVILTFDITDKDSFEGINYWMQNMKLTTSIENLCVILVGNKNDLENQRKVSKEEAQKMAQLYQVPYYETSAKSSSNVNEIYTTISKSIIEKHGVVFDTKKGEKLTNEKKNVDEKNGSCCG